MKTKLTTLILPEGTFSVPTDHYDLEDRENLKNVYDHWRELCVQLNNLNARSINLPEGLSEAAFCLFTDSVRVVKSISGANSSMDAYDINTKKRIQIKSCSVLPDLSSFGPKTQYDELYFQDFYRFGEWDYKVDVYKIPLNLINATMVNSRQTFKQVQALGKRPRFSIWEKIIVPQSLEPIISYSLE